MKGRSVDTDSSAYYLGAMRVYLTTAYEQRVALGVLRDAAQKDRFRVHEIVETPESADAILFVENGEQRDPYYKKLLANPLVSRFSDRVFMYNEYDFPYCTLPGLYAAMPKRAFDHSRQVAFSYLFRPNEFVSDVAASMSKQDLLFSFVGAPNHRIRRRVLALRDERAHIEDARSYSIWDSTDPATSLQRKRSYAEVMARSKFVLCPRGAGTSSYRLFETMEASRVPVVISDQWMEPDGPDWTFVVRIREAEVAAAPGLLRSLEGEAGDRAIAARRQWEQWFSPDVLFHRAVESICRLQPRQRESRLMWQTWLPDFEYIRVRSSRELLQRARSGRDLLRRVQRSVIGR